MKSPSNRDPRAVNFGPASLLASLPKSRRLRLRRLPGFLRALGILLLLVALTRPVQLVRLPQKTEGIDIILCLDTSSSMAAKDLEMGTQKKPPRSRLQVAKDAAGDFLENRAGDRIGLLQFARFADLLAPRTQHYDALLGILDDLQTVHPDNEEDLTGIGGAVARAAQVLSTGKAKSRVVILLTDGEENLATPDAPDEINLAEAAALCRQLAVRVYVISSRPAAAPNFARQIDVDDLARAISGVDPARQMAETTGGRYYSATDANAVSEVYALIDLLEKSELEEPRFMEVERFLPFLIIGLASLLLARLLAERKLEVLP